MKIANLRFMVFGTVRDEHEADRGGRDDDMAIIGHRLGKMWRRYYTDEADLKQAVSGINT